MSLELLLRHNFKFWFDILKLIIHNQSLLRRSLDICGKSWFWASHERQVDSKLRLLSEWAVYVLSSTSSSSSSTTCIPALRDRRPPASSWKECAKLWNKWHHNNNQTISQPASAQILAIKSWGWVHSQLVLNIFFLFPKWYCTAPKTLPSLSSTSIRTRWHCCGQFCCQMPNEGSSFKISWWM